MDGKKITFNNIENTEESEKNSKKSKIDQRLNGILSPNSNALNQKQYNKDLNRSVSPSNSFSVANSSTKNKRNAKSIVKKEINRISKVVEDFSSTKFLSEFINEKHSKDKNPNYLKKSAEKKKEFNNNMIDEINNKYNLDQNLNLKSKQKIVNGRNIAMMRQKATNNVVKINQNINNENENKKGFSNMKIKNIEFNNNKGKSRSKSKIPKREKEIIFDNKSINEKGNDFDNCENKNSRYKNNNKLYSSDNNNNVFMYSNLNNKLVSNNSNSVSNLSNLNSSFDNQNNRNFSSNNMNAKEYQGYQFNNNQNNYNPAFMNSNMSNIFSNNNSVNIANLDNNAINNNQ